MCPALGQQLCSCRATAVTCSPELLYVRTGRGTALLTTSPCLAQALEDAIAATRELEARALKAKARASTCSSACAAARRLPSRRRRVPSMTRRAASLIASLSVRAQDTTSSFSHVVLDVLIDDHAICMACRAVTPATVPRFRILTTRIGLSCSSLQHRAGLAAVDSSGLQALSRHCVLLPA